MRRRISVLAGSILLATALTGCREQWHSELVSVNAAGTDSGNGSTPCGVLSPDGTKVAFATLGSDFGPIDTNGMADVYVRDLTTGVTTLVSANADGTNGGNHVSSIPIFTPDATKVVFRSHASDLGPTDTNGTVDIYIRDLATGTTDLVSVNHAGTDAAWGGGGAENARVSADGTRVVFQGSGDYIAGDVGGPQIYVRDLMAGVTTRATVPAPGATGTGPGGLAEAEISPDGTKVAFVAADPFVLGDTNDRRDVYLRDLVAGTTTLVSRNAAGTNGANDASDQPVFSPDSNKLAFVTRGTDLGVPDAGSGADLLVRDLATGTTTLATVRPTGEAGNCSVREARFSPDSRMVAFSCSGLVAHDTNQAFDVYLRDLVAGTTELVSVNADGTGSGNGGSGGVWWDETGTRIVFASWATDLGPTDTHVGREVYVRDLASGTTSLVSANADGSDTANLGSLPLGYANGKVLFWTGADDLGPVDTNGQPDLYLAAVTSPD